MQELEYPQEFTQYKARRLQEEYSADLYLVDEDALSRHAASASYRLDGVWRQPAFTHLYIDPHLCPLPPYPLIEALLACCPIAQRDRDILLLRFKDNRTHSDIGQVFGIKRQRVQQIIERACKEVKKFLESKIRDLDKLTPLRWRYKVSALVNSYSERKEHSHGKEVR